MKAGDTWNGWYVEKLLGEGRFGKVFKITRTEYGHTYESALKVMRIPESEAEVTVARNEGMNEAAVEAYFRGMVESLVSEFTLMSELRGDSNIVSYEDHEVIRHPDEIAWDIYIRMELLTPLSEHVRKSSFTVRDVVKLGTDICSALEVCQSKNIIHRDIKPENIFYSKTGNYKLGDFGIAKEMESNSAMTKVGTLSYMAPEISKGLPYNASVDLYSLGLVLYRFLNNNRLPFLPPYPETIRHTDRELAGVRRMRGDEIPPPCNAPAELVPVVLKACAYRPEDRFSSPYEMRKALEAVDQSSAGAPAAIAGSYETRLDTTMTGQSVSGSRGSKAGKKQRKKRSPLKVIATIFAILILLVIGAAGALFYLTDYYLVYFTPEYEIGEISKEDAKYGFNGSWGFNEEKTKTIKYEDVSMQVPTNWRRFILDMSSYGFQAEGRMASLINADGNRIAWVKIEYDGEYSSLDEVRKSDIANRMNIDGKEIDMPGCDEAVEVSRFTNQDGETIIARVFIVKGKLYWVGGGAVGDNFSITNFNKMLDTCVISSDE